MGVGESSAAWVELAEGVPEGEEPLCQSRAGEPVAPVASLATQSDWVLLLGFTAAMTIPFALVAWLLH